MSRSWEPATFASLLALRELIVPTTAIEDDAASRLASVDPAGPFGELITWAWVFDADRMSVLLVDHDVPRGWMSPGGRAQPGEHPRDAAARELLEETGLRAVPAHDAALVDAVEDVAEDGSALTTFGVAFVFEADPAVPLVPEEGQDVAWFPINAPPERVNMRHWARMLRHLQR